MDMMPRPRPPYLSREVNRHGNAVWYVRRSGKRTRLRSKYGTPEFDAEYQAALAGKAKSHKRGPSNTSLSWLVARYRETTAWQGLSSATKKQRENILRQILESAGDQAFAKISMATITAGRDRRAGTPFQARHFLDTLRGLFRWALEAGFVKADPTMGVRNPPRPKGDGFIPWTEEHVAAYENRWPVGTRQRVWLVMYCSILDCVGGTPFALGGSISAMVSRRSRRRRPTRWSHFRSCLCSPKRSQLVLAGT